MAAVIVYRVSTLVLVLVPRTCVERRSGKYGDHQEGRTEFLSDVNLPKVPPTRLCTWQRSCICVQELQKIASDMSVASRAVVIPVVKAP